MSSQHRTGLWARSPQCITWVLAALTATALAVPPPHVVMIIADDLGWADVGFSHASDVRTPHIDALLSRGVRLSHYYSLPVCTPSRGALQTGRYPLVYGLQTYVIPAGTDYGLNVNETTLPSLLRDRAGYATHAIGKWHLGAYLRFSATASTMCPLCQHKYLVTPRRHGVMAADADVSWVRLLPRVLQWGAGLLHTHRRGGLRPAR